ncbi:hypothetical protein [Streptomyces sp. V1I1]|uniref:hypothetical protein n=1 Tax=Streptomyces sp. V1I1 TaxID=3042272 RepID=UPI00278B22ED|nr:hypothetical protein [Streptomyces sp. V1I1]MDQ0943956.1 hypothetical protein [Streptomyces sp. V1I1]
MGGSRLNHIARTARPMALLSAVATLLGALFLCTSPAATPSGPHHIRATYAVSATSATSASDVETAYSCPYDRGACGLLPLVRPAVLTAPPLDAPLDAWAQPPHLGPPPPASRLPRSEALPRAPGLHVLQVLRT